MKIFTNIDFLHLDEKQLISYFEKSGNHFIDHEFPP